MTTSASGTVVDAGGGGLKGLTVVLDATSKLFAVHLGTAEKVDGGQVTPFNEKRDKEEPRVILEFGSDVTFANPRHVGDSGHTDVRIERLILDKPAFPVRIQIPWPTLDHHAIPILALGSLGLALTGAL